MSTIQSLRFDKKYFQTKFKVKEWLKNTEFKPIKELTNEGNFISVRLRDPNKFKEFRTIKEFGKMKGVNAILGI